MKGYREGDERDNPARLSGHLAHTLPKPEKVKRVKHHAELPYIEVPAFMAELRAVPASSRRGRSSSPSSPRCGRARHGLRVGKSSILRSALWTVPHKTA